MKRLFKTAAIVLMFIFLLSGCGESVTVEKNEFPLNESEISAVLAENNTNWYIEKADALSDRLTGIIVCSDDENEFRGDGENPAQAEKAVGVINFYNADDGQRVAFQYMTFRPETDTFRTILPKSIAVCCDMYSIDAAESILQEIDRIDSGTDTDYSYWYKEYADVYVWLQYKVENGHMIPVVFSINDEGAHNIMLQQYSK